MPVEGIKYSTIEGMSLYCAESSLPPCRQDLHRKLYSNSDTKASTGYAGHGVIKQHIRIHGNAKWRPHDIMYKECFQREHDSTMLEAERQRNQGHRVRHKRAKPGTFRRLPTHQHIRQIVTMYLTCQANNFTTDTALDNL